MNCLNCNKPIDPKSKDSFCNDFCKSKYDFMKTVISFKDVQITEITEKKTKIQNRRSLLFGKRYENCTFDNFVCTTDNQKKTKTRVIELTRRMKESGEIIAFIGKPGTGKDHLAAAMVYELKSFSVIHTTIAKISRELREASRDKSYIRQQEIIDKYVNCKFLIINEIGVQSATTFERNILHEILDGHYRNITSCLLISNNGTKEFKTCIDEPGQTRVYDRIQNIIIFTWESQRR